MEGGIALSATARRWHGQARDPALSVDYVGEVTRAEAGLARAAPDAPSTAEAFAVDAAPTVADSDAAPAPDAADPTGE